MAYRKITVAGKDYEYIIGDTYVKIKGIGVYKYVDVGEEVPQYCDCGCGETLNDIKDETHHMVIRVTPKHVAALIKNTLM